MADKLFANYAPCDLDSDVRFLNDIVGELTTLTIDAKEDPEQRRQRLLADADAVARTRPQTRDRIVASTSNSEKLCDLEQLNDQLQLNSALKTIQIVGQILRNHFGSLTGETKKRLVSRCYSLGLRATKCLFTVLGENIDVLVESLVEALQRKQGVLPEPKGGEIEAHLRQRIKKSVWGTLELGTFAIMKYISDSVGTEHLADTFAEVLESEPSMPLELIDIAVKLEHFKGFPENETIRLVGKLHKNVFTLSVLRDLVWNKFYMYHVDYRVRQSVSAKLKITSKGQQMITGRGNQKLGKDPYKRGGPRRR